MSDFGKAAFLLNVGKTLGACQLVELELKLYIARAYELVRKRVAHALEFQMQGKDVADASLERLIGIFAKLTANQALVSELHQFRKDRNFVAHRAIVACLNPDGAIDQSAVGGIEARLNRIEAAAGCLTDKIEEESHKFLNDLFFNDQ